MMIPVDATWWLRPVNSAARVGEQSAVVWKRLYRKPFLASRAYVGVDTGPPNTSVAPKPTSSVITISTFGAPFGACTSLGHSIASEPATVRSAFIFSQTAP